MDFLKKLLSLVGLVDKVVPVVVGNRTKVCVVAAAVAKVVAVFVPAAAPIADVLSEVCGGAAVPFALAGLARK